MSFVTRCPACATAFKVVPDQLRISDGWVRCGRCSQIFDATQALQELPGSGQKPTPSAAADETVSVPVPESVSSIEVSGFAPTLPAPPGLADSEPLLPASAESQAPHSAATWSPPPSNPPSVRVPASDGAAHEGSIDVGLTRALRRERVQALRERRQQEHLDQEVVNAWLAPEKKEAAWTERERRTPAVDPLPREAEAPGRSAEAPLRSPEAARAREGVDSDHGELHSAQTQPSFLEALPAQQAEPSRRARALWGLCAMVAALLLGAQVLRHMRSELAADQPAMRPVLQSLCQFSGCAIEAYRQIDAVRIDGAGFTPERDGASYRLAFTLRNAGATPLAMPAVELSLLDGNERPVVRRVFLPKEFSAPSVLGPRAEQSVVLPLTLQAPPGGGAPPVVAGFSMLAFYP